MKLSEVVNGLNNHNINGSDDRLVTGFAIDHRKIASGNIFGAFRGAKFNGEDFIEEAIKAGAIAIVAHPDAKVDGGLHIANEEPRRIFALMAARFFVPVPRYVAAVTGTNGKTSTAEMTRQIWRMAGLNSASIGTLGVTTADEQVKTGLTTPDIVTFLSNMSGLAREGISHAIFEASSHGLSQYRTEGLPVQVAAFTNLSRDHLDYHGDMNSYFEAKMRLFDEVVDPDGTAVIWADDRWSDKVMEHARNRGLKIVTVGEQGETLQLVSRTPTQLGQVLTIKVDGKTHHVTLPLIGAYQAANILCAAGIALNTGGEIEDIMDHLQRVQPVKGRLERAVITKAGAPVYVDYAHTPDGLRAAIAALRPHVKGTLITIFGAGGDRDKGKRPEMGGVASELSDRVIVTDDNPRGEDPAAIRASIMADARGAEEIGDRREAIAKAIDMAGADDIILLAGKGHEQGQIIGDRVIPFDDVEVARECARAGGRAGGVMPLWTSSELAEAAGGKASANFDVNGVAFDSREIGPGDLFFALKGEQSDGHLYLDGVYKAGGAGAIVNEPAAGPHVLVTNTTDALNRLAVASRNRTNAKIVGVTGSVGKTGTKEALFAALDRCCFGKAHRSVKSYNNHVGVPLSLSRMPADSKYGIFEMGMNHSGELSELTQLVRPHVAIITAIAPAHIGNFENIEGIADAKAEIFEGLVADGVAIIPYDSAHYEQLRAKAAQHTDNIVSFGLDKAADVHAVEVVPAPEGGSLVTAKIQDRSLCFTISEAGKHWVSNALAIMAAVKAVGGDLAAAGLALAELGGIAGRGKRQLVDLNSGGQAIVIDESYNANPISMKATLTQFSVENCDGSKIAILGAMGELGDKAQAFHEALAEDIVAANVNIAILVGEEMSHTAAKLNDRLDYGAQISHVASASEALTEVAKIISDEDILLIKGSNYLGLAQVVNALASGEY